MNRLLLYLLLGAVTLSAQNALYIDLTGEWRLSLDDSPRYATPGFDDTGWAKVQLPWLAPPPRGIHWVRRTATLPEGTDTSRLALTLGSVGEAYEVFVNGTQIGKFGGFSNQEAQVARTLTFEIPDGAAGSSGTIEIAVRVWKLHTHGTSQWIRFSDGPYLLTYANQFPPRFGALLIRETQWARSPDFALGTLQALLAVILLAVWWTDRGRLQFLWLALFLVVDGWVNLSQVLLMAPDSFPWSWRLRTVTGFALSAAFFAEFSLADLRPYRPSIHFAIGLALLAAVAFRISDNRDAYAAVLNVTRALTLCFILLSWWRNDRMRSPWARHAMALLLLLTLFISGNRTGQQFGLGTRIKLGEFDVSTTLPLTVLLALVIVGVLLHELFADRRERLRLAAELEAARAIQQLLLPQSGSRSATWESEAVYEPALEVGGDFHWSRAGDDGSLTIVVGDVSGKGLRAAMLVSVAIGILRTAKSLPPASTLAILNEGLTGHTGGGFVTCCCARFDAHGSVTIASAGHPAPYCDGLEVTLAAGLPLGVAPGVEYCEAAGPEGGNRFAFVSDGVVEAENAKGELFGFERTHEISCKPAREIAVAAKAWGQNDDITVVTVRRI